jgi:hypothetical protein
MPFKSGNRMATMVLYCTVPEVGGHTNFRNSGVHVKPQKGNGIFFSYIDPTTLMMDNGTQDSVVGRCYMVQVSNICTSSQSDILLVACSCYNVITIGFTEHSGCPVYEGEKKIVTQWIRLGVDEQNPWDSFNTLGIKKDEVED